MNASILKSHFNVNKGVENKKKVTIFLAITAIILFTSIATGTSPFTIDADGSIHFFANGRSNNLGQSVVPVGTIQAFAGDSSLVLEGWLICDGTAILEAEYPKLFLILASADWDAAATSTEMKLPDLCGVFLRGFDKNGSEALALDPEAESTDPDVLDRNVGSFQEDTMQSHVTEITVTSTSTRYVNYWPANGDSIGSGSERGSLLRSNDNVQWGAQNTRYNHPYGRPALIEQDNSGTPRVSKETRPKNAAVLYIIKY